MLRRTLVPALSDSELSLDELRLVSGETSVLGDPERDTLLYCTDGAASFTLASGTHSLATRVAALVLAGESADVSAGAEGLSTLVATVGAAAERHAPIGPRAVVAALDSADEARATGARSFQILFGPQNGSTRATLFMGFVPLGKAPSHYHLYDEIVWIPSGPGRLHRAGSTEELGAGSAFRLRPRELHIVENAGSDVLEVLGVFTPAGSPSAAYLTADVADEYRVED
jgi:mannose-6-phosphate isomerase-like protein (cupin superfamily)